jgi:AmmeMemoRadiSam system protein A
LLVTPSEYHRDLKAVRASFVTLHIHGRLRGCIGHLEAVQPVVVDVAENAFAAAFRDPRFSPLTEIEWPDVDLHLSLLTRPVPISFRDEADLLGQLRPGEDGLVLQDGPNRGTFLPSVWESLPEPATFLAHLKQKAGLAANHWSAHVEVYRYTTESFGEQAIA